MADTPFTSRLALMIPLLGSDQPGEVVATAAAIGRVLGGAGADWHWLAAAVEGQPDSAKSSKLTDFREIAECILENAADTLSPKEREFVENMARWRGEPSLLQAEWLTRLAGIWCEAAA